MIAKALPCRFCHTEQVQVCADSNNPSKSFAKCRHCSAQAPLSVWNTRHSTEVIELAKEIEKYKRYLDDAFKRCDEDDINEYGMRVNVFGVRLSKLILKGDSK